MEPTVSDGLASRLILPNYCIFVIKRRTIEIVRKSKLVAKGTASEDLFTCLILLHYHISSMKGGEQTDDIENQ